MRMSAKAKLLERIEKLHETVELPSGRMKAPMGAPHFLLKRIPKVPTEMALRVLVYNLTRVKNMMGLGDIRP
jgi:hypothetical protein